MMPQLQFLLFVPFVALVACGEPTPGSDDDNTGPGSDPEDGSDPDDAPDWSGNWQVSVEYSYTCDKGFGDTEDDAGSDSWTLSFSGSPTNLEVQVNGNDWYTLTGSGDSDGVQLCGYFPVPDLSGDPAPPNGANSICIEADDVVAADEVHGVMTGSFETNFGFDCELDESPVVLTR